MKGLKAVLWKDLKLFRTGAGLFSLVLPLVLLCLLHLGMGDSLRQAYVQPFPIAVRDEDQTVMSRSLVSQIGQVNLFSQVRTAVDESDQELLESGCAAVFTIPKDFFFDMYSMDNGLVEVSLNREMPLEASLLRSMFVSIMDIISADQAAGRAVFRFCYGDLDGQATARMWEETSRQIILDALGRQQIFGQTQETDSLQSDLELRLLACTLSLICLFFPLSAVKTLPQELSSGVLPRYLAAGGRVWAFVLSKFLVGLLLALPSLLLLLPIFPQERPWMTLLLGLGLYLFGFSLLLCLSAWAGDPAGAQRWGNLLLLLSLVLGGALYPSQLLPGPARLAGTVTLPHWAIRGLALLTGGAGAGRLLLTLWPVWAMSALLLVLAIPGLRRTRGRILTVPAPEAAAGTPAPVDRRVSPLLPLSLQKVKAMSGGLPGLVCLLLSAALCGSLAAAAIREAPRTLRLGVVLADDDPYASQLCERLSGQEGLEVVRVDAETGSALLTSGRIEGLLTVEPGYTAALGKTGTLPLRYQSAVGTSSGQAVREIIAGQASVQRAMLRGLADAKTRLGRALSPTERETLLNMMAAEEAGAAPLYAVSGLDGAGTTESLFNPGPLSFALLAVMLTALTWCAWTGTPDARRVELRLASLPGGDDLSYGSDALALFLVSLTTGVCALLPGGLSLSRWPALLAYTFCVTGAALALCRLGSAERMDALAPFTALLTCLAGGCFGDLGTFSPALRTVSLFTPQGLALRGGSALAILAAAGLVLLYLGRRKKS